MRYRPEIDGLRAIAVVVVILFHAGNETFSGGYVGVDVFFVLSGYLITTLILKDFDESSFSIARFYERRAKRLLPALYLVVVATVPFAWAWMSPPELESFGESLIAIPLFVSNLYFWQKSDYFEPHVDEFPLLHTWSLAVEEQYYFFFPILLILAWKGGRRAVLWVVLVLAALSMGVAEWGWRNAPVANFYLSPSRAWELMVGALAAITTRRWGRQHSEFLALSGLALIGVSTVAFDEATPFPSYYATLPVIGTALVILFGSEETLVARGLACRPLVGIGLISYSTYLWHQPLFAFARIRGRDTATQPVLLGLAVVSIGLAYLSWRFVEQPARRSKRFSRRAVFFMSAVGAFCIAGCAALIVSQRGFPSRYRDDQLALIRQFQHPGHYVTARFKQHQGRPFPSPETLPKVLLIGDSFAQDLVNGVYESGLDDEMALTTYDIPVRCGNVYSNDDVMKFVAPGDRVLCEKVEGYSDPRLRELLEQADEVWLASAWRDWQVTLMEETVSNIEADFGVPMIVFGSKSFGGDVRLSELLRGDTAPSREPLAEHRESMERLRSAVGPERFVDVASAFCSDAVGCQLLSAEGLTYSYDGQHLTPTGAHRLGEHLRELLPLTSVVRRAGDGD